jgi:hypothetical protein
MPSGDPVRRSLPAQAVNVAASAAAAFAAVSGALLMRQKAAQRVPMRGGVAPGDWDSFEQLEAAKQARAALAAHAFRARLASRRALPSAAPGAPAAPCRCHRAHGSVSPPSRYALQGAKTQAPSELGWTAEGEFAPTEVDERDKGTPDDWIPRHPELVRLTGASRQLLTLGTAFRAGDLCCSCPLGAALTLLHAAQAATRSTASRR